MHNFAVIQLQILTHILPENTGMNMKEPVSEIQFLNLSLSKFNHPLFPRQILLLFVSVWIKSPIQKFIY